MAKQAERRAATSQAILTAARRLFGTQGFAATTIDEIAAGAGVAKGAVYHHFKTNEAVFEAVFDLVSRELVAEIDHRDVFFSDHQKQENRKICACVSRARGTITVDTLHRADAV